MPEQPWRNPRPAPELAELRSRTPTPQGVHLFLVWLPALVWAAVIFFASTDTFSSEHTVSVLEPILRKLFPSIPSEYIELVNHVIRKCAHFTEYFVFGLFLYRGVRGTNKGWRWSWGFTALAIAAVYAALDEVHQAFVASRTASPYDSLLDSIGAFFAIFVIYLWFRRPHIQT